MNSSQAYATLNGSEHLHPKGDTILNPTSGSEPITVTLIVRRRQKLPSADDLFAADEKHLTREDFAATYGADQTELDAVADFARARGLTVLEVHQSRRSVVVQGPVEIVNNVFGVTLQDYQGPRGKYHSHEGTAKVPAPIARFVEAVIGLHNRPVPAKHFSTALRQIPSDPPDTKALTPQQVAQLYNFPPGDGAGQTIGLYEMTTNEGPAGYSKEDLAQTMQAFGGGLKTPAPTDVFIDGVGNSGVSDGETGLDITVAAAIAPKAQIAVYFTGESPQRIIHALERMIHPGNADPQPTIVSISYGWGEDDPSAHSFSVHEFEQLGQLFQDAVRLHITVLVSSGDSGAFIDSPTQAQASYPASEPWVLACGGTAVGNVKGSSFTEYIWNDVGAAGPGATGGGVSARFPVPSFQGTVPVPKRVGTGKPGRGVPDVAGNASENSGYVQFIKGRSGPVGGTSAVAPLYAGLIARINANLGFSVGFINPILYRVAATVCKAVAGPPGPSNNSFNGVTGYAASPVWNACTGLGSVKGVPLQNELKAAHAGASPSTPAVTVPSPKASSKTTLATAK